jgi:hypothetical protein
MKSPFPGMDPYLEKYWHEVHQRLIIYTGDSLQARLPSELRARIEERVFLEGESGTCRVIYPDVHVVEHPQPWSAAAEAEASVGIEEPLMVEVTIEPMTEGYIEIIDATSGHRVITVIEFLSPTNKVPGEGQEQYLKKQREVIEAGANLVEIDLTRAGRRVLAVPSDRVPASHRTTYQVSVWRSHRFPRFELYRVPLMRRLPVIRIPLRSTDADLPLDLQALLDQCFANGRYDDLNYRVEPNPPLEAEDAAWAEDWLRAKGLR